MYGHHADRNCTMAVRSGGPYQAVRHPIGDVGEDRSRDRRRGVVRVSCRVYSRARDVRRVESRARKVASRRSRSMIGSAEPVSDERGTAECAASAGTSDCTRRMLFQNTSAASRCGETNGSYALLRSLTGRNSSDRQTIRWGTPSQGSHGIERHAAAQASSRETWTQPCQSTATRRSRRETLMRRQALRAVIQVFQLDEASHDYVRAGTEAHHAGARREWRRYPADSQSIRRTNPPRPVDRPCPRRSMPIAGDSAKSKPVHEMFVAADMLAVAVDDQDARDRGTIWRDTEVVKGSFGCFQCGFALGHRFRRVRFSRHPYDFNRNAPAEVDPTKSAHHHADRNDPGCASAEKI